MTVQALPIDDALGVAEGGVPTMPTDLRRLTHRYIAGRVRTGDLTSYTAACYRRPLDVLVEVHGNRPVALIGKATIHRWLTARISLRPSTKRTQWSYVSCFLDWLVERGDLPRNPCRSMKAPKRPRSTPRAIDEDAVRLVIDHAPDARGEAIVWLMVGLGLRCVEVHRLRVEDWSRRDGLLRVTGKFGHEREVPVTEEAADALSAYLAVFPATVGPMVRSYTQEHRAVRPGTLSHYLSRWMRSAGVKTAPRDGVSAHALRHTCASDVLDRCGDLRTVQEMLGHAHLSSTSVYLRRAGIPKMREAMNGRTYRGDEAA